jgi:hypothetical protein
VSSQNNLLIALVKEVIMRRLYTPIFSVLAIMLSLGACAPIPQRAAYSASPVASTHKRSTPAPTATPTLQDQLYTDPRLGFQLTIPRNWQAQPQPGSQAASSSSAVTFIVDMHDEQSMHPLIVIGVFHGSQMSSAFAAHGTPTSRVGPYPAFIADRTITEGRAPCLVRILLAGNDYVMADWCAPDAFSHRAQFEQVLATYKPAPATFKSQTTPAPQPQTCSAMQQQLGYTQQTSWGWQLATPMAAGWHQINSGVYICSNEGSSDWFLFQCTELINRFIYERWALPHLPGNAARYLDYYQDGTFHPGVIRTLPAGSYQISNDASQGPGSFRPMAGDVLVFQDVNNPRIGWTSGLIHSPGHVALITGVDHAYVYVAQENYNNTQYFLALPIHQVADGYEITDLSGWSQRIVRGWIHFTANGGPLPAS